MLTLGFQEWSSGKKRAQVCRLETTCPWVEGKAQVRSPKERKRRPKGKAAGETNVPEAGSRVCRRGRRGKRRLRRGRVSLTGAKGGRRFPQVSAECRRGLRKDGDSKQVTWTRAFKINSRLFDL